jgi:hypothetical protein
MRKILTILTLTLANTIFAQLAPGNYSYRNSDAQITFTVTDDGQTIKDCIIRGTNDISMIPLRQYKSVGTGEFVKITPDSLKPSPFTGYYSVVGEMPTYEIKIKSNPEIISIVIGVKLKSTQLIRE